MKASLQRAYRSTEVAPARRLLLDLVRRLETDHPSAAESVREGLDETLTVLGLHLSEALRRSLVTTNAAESLISRTRQVKRNVKCWRGGQMIVPVGRRRCTRSRQRLPASEGPQSDAATRRGPTGTRSTTRACHGRRERRIVITRAAAEFQQPTGQRSLGRYNYD